MKNFLWEGAPLSFLVLAHRVSDTSTTVVAISIRKALAPGTAGVMGLLKCPS